MGSPFVLYGSAMWEAERLARERPREAVRRERRLGPGVIRPLVAILVVAGITLGALEATRPVAPETHPTDGGRTRLTAATSLVDLARIHLVNLRTGDARPLPRAIRAIPGVEHVQAGPQGERLAFDDGRRIYVAKLDGTHLRPVTPADFDRSAEAPSWSADGRRLVFTSGSKAWVVVVATRSTERVVGGRGDILRVGFGPDGSFLYTRALGRRLRTYLQAPNGTMRRIHLVRAAFAAFSPDGRWIAYRKTAFDGLDPTEMTSDTVWLARARGGAAHRLGGGGAWMSQIDEERLWPSWSPDGTRIAFESLFGHRLKVIGARDGDAQILGYGRDPTWLDDHTLIVQDYRKGQR